MDSINQIEDRIQDVEILIGNQESVDDLIAKLRSLYQQLKALYRSGIQCTESFWTLLDCFTRANDFSEDEGLQQRFLVCSDSIEELLMRLLDLDLVYQEENVDHVLSCGLLNKAGSASADLEDLPALYEHCNSLLVATVCSVRRFIDLNLETNEFWTDIGSRMHRVENDIHELTKKRSI